jgi:hypothetical protein
MGVVPIQAPMGAVVEEIHAPCIMLLTVRAKPFTSELLNKILGLEKGSTPIG